MSEPTYSRYAEAYEAIHSALRTIMAPRKGEKITKLGFWEDVNGDLKYIKAYDGETVIFTLEFSNAGEATEETWNITRTEP